ncbi:MAG: DUF948 domain-containing protein [Armatimonadetes bacterium]|nr:DUF948 domain-containing protein [Armatimonadota bacterium]NIO75148.1 DUF948 domain-containing protein [Armatimonadota bacterium]NIO95772.1 DUF948 domain-containing protein [Armatimonadota bacterium]
MSALVTMILFILYAAIVVLVVYLILLVVKLSNLTDDLRRAVREQVTPCLHESKETISKFNDVGTQVKKIVDAISRALGTVQERVADTDSPALGRTLGFQVAKKAATWLAGLSRAAKAVRSDKKEKDAETPEGSE